MSNFENPEKNPYKFRDLKVYASTEWLADNKKKYRQVFDRYETSYIYAELSFFNKFFDQEDWTVSITLKCYSLKKGRKELCDWTFERKVSKYDNIVYIREGWGNKKLGAFWKKGTYYWEAYINGEKCATKYFYIEESGLKELDPSAYMSIRSLRLYEGPYDDLAATERTYLRGFAKEETRCVFVEMNFENRQMSKAWYCEILVKFYNGAKQLKGQTVKLQHIDANQEKIEITANWGSNIKGSSWSEDDYTAEIIFMDKLLATIPFKVGEEAELGSAAVVLPNQYMATVLDEDDSETGKDFEDVIKSLEALVGLHDLKRQVRDHANYLKFLQLRREKGFAEKEGLNIHSVFIGNPGTGKTTVAKMMGLLYKSMGLLSKGHVHEVDRVDLVGEYIGQTAPKVREAIEKARGGVLFIDEAYALARSNDDSKDFGREVIEILVKEMSNGPGDMAVIAAGYPKEMKHFLDSNPGLRSRFKLFFDFPDYLPDELIAISAYAAEMKAVRFDEEAKFLLDDLITDAYRRRDRSFGNARFVFDLVEQAKLYLGLRVMRLEQPSLLLRDELALVQRPDMELVAKQKQRRLPNLPIDEKLLTMSMNELNLLIGMDNIKQEISELVRLVRFHRESKRNVLNKFYLHTVFVGNPGTGKTTVARILTKIYKALGILERGHMVETDRQGLVAGYVGQTAIKTSERIEESMGGVLFIDEAYALTSGGSGSAHGDFGNEAIQTLLKRMEDDRGAFFVFVAGYPENMDNFLKANPGLRSRFDKVLKFEDYSAKELFEIANLMLQDEGLSLDANASEQLQAHFETLHLYRDKYFGNARTVRTLVNEITKNQSLRLAALNPADRLEEVLNLITYDDLSTLSMQKDDDSIFNKKSIGFREKAR